MGYLAHWSRGCQASTIVGLLVSFKGRSFQHLFQVSVFVREVSPMIANKGKVNSGLKDCFYNLCSFYFVYLCWADLTEAEPTKRDNLPDLRFVLFCIRAIRREVSGLCTVRQQNLTQI